MPHDPPHWSTVYHYFRQWQKEGVWEKAVQALVRRDREREGRPASPSALVMDSQSVKTTDWTYAASTCTGNRGLKSRLSLPAMSLRRHW
jgi:transposase